jgi:hypothetical protein
VSNQATPIAGSVISSTARYTASPSGRGAWTHDTAAYLARKHADGKSPREALRCLNATSPAASGGCSKAPATPSKPASRCP